MNIWLVIDTESSEFRGVFDSEDKARRAIHALHFDNSVRMYKYELNDMSVVDRVVCQYTREIRH
jgi:hypothetical protein